MGEHDKREGQGMATVRVLIAEDNEVVAGSLEQQLGSLGYEVLATARNGVDVLRLCQQLRPDVVLLDLQTRELSGETARQIGEQAPTPIVIITDFADSEAMAEAEEAKAFAYLVKPINPEEIPPAIDIAVARYDELRQLREHAQELHQALESRKLIERAKGILMKRLNIGDREAEERIRQRAKEKQLPTKEIAQAIIDSDALLS